MGGIIEETIKALIGLMVVVAIVVAVIAFFIGRWVV